MKPKYKIGDIVLGAEGDYSVSFEIVGIDVDDYHYRFTDRVRLGASVTPIKWLDESSKYRAISELEKAVVELKGSHEDS